MLTPEEEAILQSIILGKPVTITCTSRAQVERIYIAVKQRIEAGDIDIKISDVKLEREEEE